MTFATFTNIIVMLLCGAVLVQSVRLIRGFQAVKDGGLKDVVASLEAATAQARAVLSDLKDTLRTDGAANARAITEGEAIRDELSVMVGIANAVAERIVETVEANRPAKAKERAKPGAPIAKGERAAGKSAPAKTPVTAAPSAKATPVKVATTDLPVKVKGSAPAAPAKAALGKRARPAASQPAGKRAPQPAGAR